MTTRTVRAFITTAQAAAPGNMAAAVRAIMRIVAALIIPIAAMAFSARAANQVIIAPERPRLVLITATSLAAKQSLAVPGKKSWPDIMMAAACGARIQQIKMAGGAPLRSSNQRAGPSRQDTARLKPSTRKAPA